MKKAFTLAEVLVTLAIIGVVAALTIPAVITNYNKNQFYTRFIKMHNTLTTAFQLSAAQNGDPVNWALHDELLEGVGVIGGENDFREYFGNYLKISKYCTNDAEACGAEGQKVYMLNGEEAGDYSEQMVDNAAASFIMQDGAYVVVWQWISGRDLSEINVDTNGPSKGPNTWGRDIFHFTISNRTPNKNYIVYPYGLFYDEGVDIEKYVPRSLDDSIIVDCEADGEACGARLLLEGKMNY